MFPTAISNSTSLSEEASTVSSAANRVQDLSCFNPTLISPQQQQKTKKKRSLPGNPGKNINFFNLNYM